MTTRQTRILNRLQQGDVTNYELACILDAPEASVRRDIQALRTQGYSIVNTLNLNRLWQPITTALAGHDTHESTDATFTQSPAFDSYADPLVEEAR